MSSSNSNNQFSLRSILDKEKLSGPNFLDWQRNLRIALMQEQKEYVLDEEMPEAPNEEVTQAALNRWQSANRDVKCIMLATMSPELQKNFFEKEMAFEIISELQNMSKSRPELRGLKPTDRSLRASSRVESQSAHMYSK